MKIGEAMEREGRTFRGFEVCRKVVHRPAAKTAITEGGGRARRARRAKER
jgi:hypothetical protein